jgi:hypothetical protein
MAGLKVQLLVRSNPDPVFLLEKMRLRLPSHGVYPVAMELRPEADIPDALQRAAGPSPTKLHPRPIPSSPVKSPS